jgi:type I restriction enzyme S subunit
VSWPLVKLGELVTIKGGGTPSKKVKEYWNGDIPWASVKDLKTSYISKTVDSITKLGVSNSATNIIPAGTILTATRMALGKFAINTVDMAINQDLKALFVNDDTNVDRDFLIRFLESKAQYIDSEGKGATVKGVTLDFLKSLEIPLPPLDEQKRIAAILDKADAIRRKRQEAIQLADDFLRSVFLDMFGDHFSTEGYITSHKKKVKDLVDYIDYRGKTPTKSESGVPLITAKNVKKGFISEEPREFIPESNYTDWMTRGLPLEGDVLFTTEAPLGSAALLGRYEKVVVGQRLIALRTKGELTQEYLLYCLLNEFIQSEIYKRSSGSTVKGIRTKELYEIKLPVPDFFQQQKFSEIYRKSIESKSRLLKTVRESEHMFNSLSQKAFAGEL